MRHLPLALLAAALAGCATDAPQAADPTPADATAQPMASVETPAKGPGAPLKSFLPPGVAMAGAPAAAKAPEAFGEPVSAGEAIPLAKVLAAPDEFAGKKVIVAADVRTACQKKGCWMELASEDASAPGCRVTFKNYGFFVPKDAAGARARVEGVVEVKKVEKAEVEHLESEGGKFTKAADGSAREVRIVASGVELVRP